MDKLEPIRQVFRNAGLYHHAADDLLCGELLRASINAGPHYFDGVSPPVAVSYAPDPLGNGVLAYTALETERALAEGRTPERLETPTQAVARKLEEGLGVSRD